MRRVWVASNCRLTHAARGRAVLAKLRLVVDVKTRHGLGKPVGGTLSEKRGGEYGSTGSGGRCAPARSSTRSSSIWSVIWAAIPWKTAFMSSWRALSWHELAHGRAAGCSWVTGGAARPGHQGRGARPLAPGTTVVLRRPRASLPTGQPDDRPGRPDTPGGGLYSLLTS
jgi:hypothetical protein